MVSFDLDFYPREDARGKEWEQFDEQLVSFLGWLWNNGNIGLEYITLELEDRVQARVVSPAPDAMELSNWSVYALNDWEKLAGLVSRPTVITQVAQKNIEQTWCDHVRPPFYLLFDSWFNFREAPVHCGQCGRDVPLYRLPLCEPPNGAQDASRFVNWRRTYSNLDSLWLGSGVGERYATKQLERPKSDFMRETRELAATLEEKSGVPTYSFLKHYYQKWNNRCPLCKRKWKWKTPPEELRKQFPRVEFAFRCKHCRLISELSSWDTPLSELHP